MPTYIQKNINSDLTPFIDFNKEMSVGSGTDTSIVIAGITNGSSKTLGFITPSGVPNSNVWEDGGTWTVELETDVSNNQVNARIRCVRLNTSGTILQSGIFTATQSLNISRVFSPVAPSWTDSEESLDNRLAIEIEFNTTQAMEQSVSVGVGTSANEVITDISENLMSLNNDIDLFMLGRQTTNFRGNMLEDTIFFVDDGTDKVHSVPIPIPSGKTAATRDDIVGLVSGLTTPEDLALDLQDEKIYWTDSGTDKIQRSNLDGSDIEDIVISLNNPKGIALDLDNNQIYYVDSGAQKIHRSNLDGSNQENLVGGLSGPRGIALDIPSGRMFFTSAGGTKVRSANTDGSDITALITTDAAQSAGIALDLETRKMYWSDTSQGNIKRAGMVLPSGETPGTRTDVEELVTGLTMPNWIAIDPIQKKLYWTDSGTDKIQRSNLDGSNVEDIVSTGLVTPLGLALITSSDIITLFIKGITSISGSMTLVINGPETQIAQLDLFLANRIILDDLNLFTSGKDIITSDLDLLINGHEVVNNNLDLVILTKDIINDNLDLVIVSKDTASATLDLVSLGHDTVNNDLQLIIIGHEKSSSDLDLVLKSKDFITSDITLIIRTMQKEDISVDLFISGKDLDESDLNLILNGHIVDSDSITLVMPDAKDSITKNLDIIIIGNVVSSGDIDLITKPKDSISSNITLMINTFDRQDTDFNLSIRGHKIVESDLNLITMGDLPNSGSLNLSLLGFTNISGVLNTHIFGKDTVNSDITLVMREPTDEDTITFTLIITGHEPIDQTTTTIGIKQDSTIKSPPLDDTKFGLEEILIVGRESGVSNRALMVFDISSIPSGATIQESHIEGLTLISVSGSQEFRSHPVTKEWIEDEVTWNERSSGIAWDSPGSDFVSGIFDVWTVGSASGEVKTDIITTNVVQNAVNSGLLTADVLLKEHIEASVTTQISSQQNPSGGPVLIVTFTTIQPDIDLFTIGHETITSGLDLVIINPLDNISSDLDLVIDGSGITPVSGLLLTLCINGVVAKTFDPADPPCPPLDPLASIQISDELIGIYQSRIDALINQLGKNIILEFEKIKVRCPNCFFDTMRNRSNGIHRIGGPRPFARGRRCPHCKGNGFEESDNNKCIKALLKWNPRDAANYGLTMSDSKGIVRIKTFLTEFDDLKRAITVIANHDMESIAKLRVKLLKGPIPVGLREDRYCISFWELIDD